jgi:sugar lactone lactonase YvrE
VPTCVAKGPGGNLYVGELAPGARHNGGVIFRYNIAKHHISVWKRGFNVVDGCGFDKAGNFYAVEFQATGFNPGPMGNPAGDVIEISKSGKRSVLGAGKLFYPQGFATDSSGNVYVSNWSIMPGKPSAAGAPTGQIVRISP